MRLAVVVSRFNESVTNGLCEGAKMVFAEKKIPAENVEFYNAPGAFEIPLIAQELAKSNRFDGIICLGCVIKGDTAHFEFISLGATMGIQEAMMKTGVPIAFGIITTYTDEQAMVRSSVSGLSENNKGREAALACIETIETLKKIRSSL
jgi:6,7-dimethyl-8-ribityllumazine synthase